MLNTAVGKLNVINGLKEIYNSSNAVHQLFKKDYF